MREQGGFRLKFPAKDSETCEAVLVNTGGGMTGGDVLDLRLVADKNTHTVFTTQAAEKIYRSQGNETRLATTLELADKCHFAFLPQETILFSGARVHRSLEVQMAADATLIAAESVVLGRAASGESLDDGAFRDRWRIRRNGKLIFAEDVRLEGLLNLVLQRKAVANGAGAIATLVMISPEAESLLEPARDMLQSLVVECGVSAWNGMLVMRMLGQEAQTLRRDLASFLVWLRAVPLPRVWQC